MASSASDEECMQPCDMEGEESVQLVASWQIVSTGQKPWVKPTVVTKDDKHFVKVGKYDRGFVAFCGSKLNFGHVATSANVEALDHLLTLRNAASRRAVEDVLQDTLQPGAKMRKIRSEDKDLLGKSYVSVLFPAVTHQGKTVGPLGVNCLWALKGKDIFVEFKQETFLYLRSMVQSDKLAGKLGRTKRKVRSPKKDDTVAERFFFALRERLQGAGEDAGGAAAGAGGEAAEVATLESQEVKTEPWWNDEDHEWHGWYHGDDWPEWDHEADPCEWHGDGQQLAEPVMVGRHVPSPPLAPAPPPPPPPPPPAESAPKGDARWRGSSKAWQWKGKGYSKSWSKDKGKHKQSRNGGHYVRGGYVDREGVFHRPGGGRARTRSRGQGDRTALREVAVNLSEAAARGRLV